MTTSHEALVEREFGPQAQAYVSSLVHATGADLDWIEDIVRATGPAHALDLGSGGGHVAYRLARHAGQVTACDLSGDMVGAVLATANTQGLSNIAGAVAPAEALPFAAHGFDFLACRFSAHHWRDFEAGLREARRVLAPGRPALFVDAVAPDDAAVDTHLQAIELLRDTSHVRDYRPDEWLAALARAGFRVRAVRTWPLRIEFASWIERMRTPPDHVAAIRSLQRQVSAATLDRLGVESDGSFLLPCMAIEAV